MLNQEEKKRLEFLEAKAYMEYGLNENDSKELDNLIRKTNEN
jgi:hypothetical protein